MIIVNKKA